MKKYIIKNTKTKKYLEGYVNNTPVWTDIRSSAYQCPQVLLKRLIQRLTCQSQRVEAIASG